jgi:hypothetical protein
VFFFDSVPYVDKNLHDFADNPKSALSFAVDFNEILLFKLISAHIYSSGLRNGAEVKHPPWQALVGKPAGRVL